LAKKKNKADRMGGSSSRGSLEVEQKKLAADLKTRVVCTALSVKGVLNDSPTEKILSRRTVVGVASGAIRDLLQQKPLASNYIVSIRRRPSPGHFWGDSAVAEIAHRCGDRFHRSSNTIAEHITAVNLRARSDRIVVSKKQFDALLSLGFQKKKSAEHRV
jgi:hypothetical protein